MNSQLSTLSAELSALDDDITDISGILKTVEENALWISGNTDLSGSFATTGYL